jgi:MYXO-CTERM domain-containing protein
MHTHSSLRSWTGSLVAAACAVFSLTSPKPAHACDPVEPDPLQVDPARRAVDSKPPSQPRIASVEVYRAKDQGTCGSFGVIHIEVADASDDQSKLGYQLDVVSGRAPTAVKEWASQPQVLGRTPSVYIDTDYGETANTDFTFTITLIDAAGNRGQPSLPARAVFSGCTMEGNSDKCSSGCSVAPGGKPAATLPPVMLVLGAVAMRRRRRSRASAKARARPELHIPGTLRTPT